MTMTMTIDLPDSFSLELRSLLIGLLQRDVNKRLGCRGRGADEVKSHPFFRGIDWRVVYLQRLTPPLIPARGEVNAADAFDIGSFDDEDTKHIKLTDADQELYRNFPVVVSERWQHEIAETIFDYINHEADKAEMKRKNKNKLGYQEEEEQSDCILHGYVKRLGGTFTATWLTRYVRLYPNRLELWSDSSKQAELIFMDQIEEVCNDFVLIKNEQCIVIKLYNHSKYVLTNSDEIGLKEWHLSLKAAHRESLDMMTTMAEKATKIYGTEIPLKHMGKRRQQLQQEAGGTLGSGPSGGLGAMSASNWEQKIIQKELQASSKQVVAAAAAAPAVPAANNSATKDQTSSGIDTSGQSLAAKLTPSGQSEPAAVIASGSSSGVGGTSPGVHKHHHHHHHHHHKSVDGQPSSSSGQGQLVAGVAAGGGSAATSAGGKHGVRAHHHSGHRAHHHHHRHHHHHHHAGDTQLGATVASSSSAAASGGAHHHHHHHHHHARSMDKQPAAAAAAAPVGLDRSPAAQRRSHPNHGSLDQPAAAASISSAAITAQIPSSHTVANKVGDDDGTETTRRSQQVAGEAAAAAAKQPTPDSATKQADEVGDKLARLAVGDDKRPAAAAGGQLPAASAKKVAASTTTTTTAKEDQDNLLSSSSSVESADNSASDSLDDSQSSCSSQSEPGEPTGPAAAAAAAVAAVGVSATLKPAGSGATPVGAGQLAQAVGPGSAGGLADKAERLQLAVSLENVSDQQEVLKDPSKRITSDNKQREQDLVAQYEKLNVSSRNSNSSIENELEAALQRQSQAG